MKAFTEKRLSTFICLAVIGFGGFFLWRYWRGPAEHWVRFYLTGAIYVMFWCLVFFFIWPTKANTLRIPVIVFIATCILEFLQLWKPEFLMNIRDTLIGAAILGTCFVLLQFPYYILGMLLSILLLKHLSKYPSN